MGLFDLFKRQKKETSTSQTEEHTIEETESSAPVYDIMVKATDCQTDHQIIERIARKIIDEDPFQIVYKGLSDQDLTNRQRALYKYAEMSTMTVDINLQQSGVITIEGITLGNLPSSIIQDMKRYTDKHMLTTYVFVSGGPYKTYSIEEKIVLEKEEAFNLDIFISYH
ncbi:hypothetical protein BW721_00420 [Jeotgalibaca sp. PTS2502]|uniref:hypothetical protein n=1 Tax=Jeotgalibaca sp. PTS2502 TaxID=1903686 RepID=UPI00097364C2|nr:hypothetical protein [Jeotgalibaca sp. PTS2502]APZ48271.1 hypothetical protein BW721_00420 [Jeotgalibaca sp. PTS2502]